MKTLKTFILMLGILLTSVSLFSCLDDDDAYSADGYALGIVTVKPLSESSYYLQLDDSTTLWPVDGYIPFFGLEKERRALVNFTPLADNIDGYDYAIKINRIDSILTKSIVEDLKDRNDEVYGTDPVRLATYPWSQKGAWIEDGYLNIHFISYFGGYKPHFLNLVKMDEAESPYELQFRHHAYDDPHISEGQGLVAFRLNSLPDTNGKTVKLKIHYRSFDGDKTVELDYNSDRMLPTGPKPAIQADELQVIN